MPIKIYVKCLQVKGFASKPKKSFLQKLNRCVFYNKTILENQVTLAIKFAHTKAHLFCYFDTKWVKNLKKFHLTHYFDTQRVKKLQRLLLCSNIALRLFEQNLVYLEIQNEFSAHFGQNVVPKCNPFDSHDNISL